MLVFNGALGMIGGLLCAVADVFLDYKGKGNEKLGKYGIIDSNWDAMRVGRFKVSILLATAGVPLYLYGFLSMADQLRDASPLLGGAFWFFASAGSIGGYFIHNIVCLMPVIHKTMGSASFDEKERVINAVFDAIKVPFVIMFIFLVGVTSLLLAYAVIVGYLRIHWAFLFLTPLSLMTIGITLRKINGKAFADLPGILMPSMGISMIGLMAILGSLGS